jgi:hypothetical protein
LIPVADAGDDGRTAEGIDVSRMDRDAIAATARLLGVDSNVGREDRRTGDIDAAARRRGHDSVAHPRSAGADLTASRVDKNIAVCVIDDEAVVDGGRARNNAAAGAADRAAISIELQSIRRTSSITNRAGVCECNATADLGRHQIETGTIDRYTSIHLTILISIELLDASDG